MQSKEPKKNLYKWAGKVLCHSFGSIAIQFHFPSISFYKIKNTFLDNNNKNYMKHYIRVSLEWKKSEDLSLSFSWLVGPWVGHYTSLYHYTNFFSSKMGVIHSFSNYFISFHYVPVLLSLPILQILWKNYMK